MKLCGNEGCRCEHVQMCALCKHYNWNYEVLDNDLYSDLSSSTTLTFSFVVGPSSFEPRQLIFLDILPLLLFLQAAFSVF